MQRYNPKEIEPRRQKYWDEKQTYKADLSSKKPKYIAMSMFNYPSGAGIHIGHAMNYTISDVLARFKRQQGYESYHPVGWDSFGLPAENYAIKAGVSPQESMATIIPNYHKQYKAMGWSNDWSKEISTHLPVYYKWTQWIFSEMFRAGLAYQDARMQWWCDKCQTVLANEQVIDDKCWRHDSPDDPEVNQREVKQWFFKITDYADELLEATDALDWTESVKLAQKNWIGKSVGAEVNFSIDEYDDSITVFTTRPDTLFGATFLVLAPEHELIDVITTSDQKSKVQPYVKESLRKSEVERQANKQKTGVFTGAYAVNPVNDQKIPIWVADYVLSGYGTGAIMAVPAHDERDNEFAKKFDIPIIEVVEPLFINDADESAVRPGLPLVERDAITAIVKHWSEDKYIGLKWKKVDWDTFITGGVEDGQTAEEAAIAEIREETGYTNLKMVKQLDNFHAQFFHGPKNQNRFAHFSTFYFELQNDSNDKVSDKEKQNHDVVWLTPAEMEDFRLPPGHRHVWEQLQGLSSLYTGEGIMANSGAYNGIDSALAREKIVADLVAKSSATEKTNYKLRDWSVSRQRYWGAPIPIIYCKDCGPVLVPDNDLPVVLPEVKDFQPSGDGRSALARATDWLNVECPKCGKEGERETDTLDTYICSSWYMLRYFDPANEQAAFGTEIANKWMPIDFYNGADHATAHMIYARFITRFFHKKGLVDNPEPFKQFLFNGKVTAQDGMMFSKSKGNGVDPLEIIGQGYGADALRTYLMFAAPLELGARWDPKGVPGTFRFLTRLWNLTQEYLSSKAIEVGDTQKADVLRATHTMIKKVTEDLEGTRYNTAIAATMGCLNELYRLKTKEFGQGDVWKEAIESMIACVAPFAPHITEELWHELGHETSVHADSWPHVDNKYLVSDVVTIVVQVNGKVRAQLQVVTDSAEEETIAIAKKDEKVASYLEGKELVKTIYIKNKLLSFVIK